MEGATSWVSGLPREGAGQEWRALDPSVGCFLLQPWTLDWFSLLPFLTSSYGPPSHVIDSYRIPYLLFRICPEEKLYLRLKREFIML